MLKKCLLFLMLFSVLPICAGELENAINKRDNVFLYLYTPNCGYCTKFTPRYNKLSKMYDSKFAFVKIDASTNYGITLARKYRAGFVPYVMLLNKNKSQFVSPSCLSDNVCVENAIKKF